MRFLPVIILLGACLWSTHADSKVEQLITLRGAAKDGIIQPASGDFERFAAPASKEYSLIVFCNAVEMKETGNLKLQELRKGYQMLASHVKNAAKNPELKDQANRVFFVELDFKNSRDLFHRLGVQALPWVMHIGPDNRMKANRMWTISETDRMQTADYSSYPWSAKDFAKFVYTKTGTNFGEVTEPKLINNVFFIAILALMVIPLAMLGWRIYTSSWIGHPMIWTVAVLAVFWFATSGGMFNIIRGVPLMAPGPAGRVKWYTHQGQLGMEGFAVGTMYICFATACATLIRLPKWLGGTPWCRPACYANLVFAAFLFAKILNFYSWKTGYGLKIYMFRALFG